MQSPCHPPSRSTLAGPLALRGRGLRHGLDGLRLRQELGGGLGGHGRGLRRGLDGRLPHKDGLRVDPVRGEKLARRSRRGLDGRVNRRLPFGRGLRRSENRDGFELLIHPLAARAALARERRGALAVEVNGTESRRRPHGTRGGRVQVNGHRARRRRARRFDHFALRRAGDGARGGAARRDQGHGRAILARNPDEGQQGFPVDRAARRGDARHHVERASHSQELRRRDAAVIVALGGEPHASDEVRQVTADVDRNILHASHDRTPLRGTHRASRVHVVAWIARIVTLA